MMHDVCACMFAPTNYNIHFHIHTVENILSMNTIKQELNITEEQLKTQVGEADLPELAACFDNTEDYVEKLELSPGQQTDVRTQTYVNGTQAGMKLALKLWRSKYSLFATFRAILVIVLSLHKGDIAMQVCKYLSDKYSKCISGQAVCILQVLFLLFNGASLELV